MILGSSDPFGIAKLGVGTIREVEDLVRAEVGPKCLPVKLGGYWLIHYRDGDDRRLLAQSRSLPRAIAEAKAAL